MSYAHKHAVAAIIVWALILCGLIAVVVVPGVQQFDDAENAILRVLAALIILPGFVLNAWLGWRSKKGHRLGELDERDDAIARKASEVTLIVVAVLVYCSSLLLYETHHTDGSVPAGWLYLIAYGTVSVLSLVHALTSLILDTSGSADA